MDFQWGWFIAAYCVNGTIMAYLCYSLAARKYYENAVTYAILGFFFGILTLLFAAGLPDLKNRQLIDELKEDIERLMKNKNHGSGAVTNSKTNYLEKPEFRDEGENSEAYRKAELEILPEKQRQYLVREQTKPNLKKESASPVTLDQLTFCYHCGSDLLGNTLKCPACGKDL